MYTRKAILLPGQLRFKDINHFNNFYNKIRIYDIYIYLLLKNMNVLHKK